jgi:hypothetical protein
VQDSADDALHQGEDCPRGRGLPRAVGEQQVARPDQGQGEDVRVRLRRQPPRGPLRLQVGADRVHRLGRQRHPRRPRLAQPGAQLVSEGDQRDHRYRDRAEQRGQRRGQVAGDAPRAHSAQQDRGLRLLLGGAVKHQGGQEVIEVREVAVQHPLGHARLVGDGTGGQPAGAVPQQYPLGRGEEPVPSVLEGDTGGHGRYAPVND